MIVKKHMIKISKQDYVITVNYIKICKEEIMIQMKTLQLNEKKNDRKQKVNA